MKRKNLQFGEGFHLAIGNATSQAAHMTLSPGKSEGGPTNRHVGSDQWLYVVEGEGVAIINAHRYDLKPHSIVLIERGDTHEIRAAGDRPLRTLNIYVPPAYRDDETPLPSGQS